MSCIFVKSGNPRWMDCGWRVGRWMDGVDEMGRYSDRTLWDNFSTVKGCVPLCIWVSGCGGVCICVYFPQK